MDKMKANLAARWRRVRPVVFLIADEVLYRAMIFGVMFAVAGGFYLLAYVLTVMGVE